MKKLVILSDCGLDDACAVAYLIRHGKLFDGIDIVSVAGNVSEERSFCNLKRLIGALELESAGITRFVRLCSSKVIKQRDCPLPVVHGNDGMGDLSLNSIDTLNVVEFDAVLNDILVQKDNCIVLSLGPLTVTRHIFDRCGDIKPKLVIMAGVVNEKPNYEGVEFNQALDIPSFVHCVKSFEHVIATLDTCRVPQFNLAGHRFYGSILNQLVNRAIELAEARHIDNSYIYDLISALYLTKPDIFSVQRAITLDGTPVHELLLKDKNFFLWKEF